MTSTTGKRGRKGGLGHNLPPLPARRTLGVPFLDPLPPLRWAGELTARQLGIAVGKRIDKRSRTNVQEAYHAVTARTRIFLVHGHDEKLLKSTKRMLRRMGFSVIVMQEEPGHGATPLAVKLEQCLQGAEAVVVLMTPDDRAESNDCIEWRARQNVIYEYGYCVSALGRERVIPLYHPAVEVPSDILGLSYIDVTKPHYFAKLRAELAELGLVSLTDTDPAEVRAIHAASG